MLSPSQSTPDSEQSPGNIPVPASRYSFEELAEIYNAARVDYIVPMPMNARRMEEYVHNYNIDLEISLVAVDGDDSLPNGICMFGVRGERGWITRLGVIPERRRRRTGEFLMQQIIAAAYQRQMRLIQLEVIKGNEPAYRLFQKLGFEDIRELIIIRRPPGRLKPEQQLSADILVEPIDSTIVSLLDHRESNASWVEETSSLINSGDIRGLRVTLESGESGWIAFQRTPFVLTHFVMMPEASPALMYALIAGVHSQHPLQDTRIENIPVDHPAWIEYQKLGYFETFRRIEMVLNL